MSAVEQLIHIYACAQFQEKFTHRDGFVRPHTVARSAALDVALARSRRPCWMERCTPTIQPPTTAGHEGHERRRAAGMPP